jgi:cobalt-zinc-cadmium efflux system membrane fusion protein
MNKKIAYLISLIAVVFLGFAASRYFTPQPKEIATERIEKKSHDDIDEHGHQEENVIFMPPEQIKNLDIQTQIARSGDLAVTISTRGKLILHPDRLVHVLPKISGLAREAFKNIGDSVAEGDLLALLESREMADTKAGYLAAKEKLDLSTSLLEREKRLYEKKVSAEQDYLNAKSVYEEARINVQLALQRLRAFGVTEKEIEALTDEKNPDLRLYEIRSPMKGIVIARHITKGEFIENTTTIYEIADLDTIWIEIGIYPKDLIKVQKGQLVDIFLPDGKVAAAKIIYLSPIIQDETITAKAVAELKNTSQNWRPGSFVKVNIATESVTAPIVIPKDAYQEIDGKDFIFVRIPEGFEKRQVQLGVNNDTSVEVLSGLDQGEEYASSKTFLLKADLSKKEAEHEH